jgi:RES domain-containing protein
LQIVTFRLTNFETPLWAVGNFDPGRYNRVGAPATQYLSLHPMTAWAELLRAGDRRTRERALLLRYPLWAIKASLAEAPVEVTFENAAGHGVPAADALISDDWTACQALADRFREEGVRAFVAPSAALPGTRNLVILEPAVATGFDVEPVDEVDLPVAMAAQDGHCPDGLWNVVHYRGTHTPHAGYQAWLDGKDDFLFTEPPVVASGLALG